MRIPTTLMAALALLPLHSQSPGNIPLFGKSGVDGQMYHWEIPNRRADALPKWASTSEAVPLSIQEAVEIATKWVKANNPNVEYFQLATITLANMAIGRGRGNWHYRIDFDLFDQNKQRVQSHKSLAVILFDRTVVEPKSLGVLNFKK